MAVPLRRHDGQFEAQLIAPQAVCIVVFAMNEVYRSLGEALLIWEKKVATDANFDRLWAEFAEMKSLFASQVVPEDQPLLLSLHVEMHRLLRLIESDLTLLKTARSPENKAKRREQILQRSALLRTLWDREG